MRRYFQRVPSRFFPRILLTSVVTDFPCLWPLRSPLPALSPRSPPFDTLGQILRQDGPHLCIYQLGVPRILLLIVRQKTIPLCCLFRSCSTFPFHHFTHFIPSTVTVFNLRAGRARHTSCHHMFYRPGSPLARCLMSGFEQRPCSNSNLNFSQRALYLYLNFFGFHFTQTCKKGWERVKKEEESRAFSNGF